jgi:CRISPR-associated protein (TIGR03986 family)
MTARAPYNFVRLPEKVIGVREHYQALGLDPAYGLPPHDRFLSGKHWNSGYFDVTLTTESPLYIRGLLNELQAREQKQDKSKHRNRPEFFNYGDTQAPVIPGSSLRGMIRSLVEIITFGKLERMSEKQLFFRTVSVSAIGEVYRQRMIRNGRPLVESGFLRQTAEGWKIFPCQMARVHRDLIARNKNDLYTTSKRMSDKVNTPVWSSNSAGFFQHCRVWVKLSTNDQYVDEILLTDPQRADYHEGILIITGDIPTKQKEFVFLLPTTTNNLDIAEEMIERFHDNDQITFYQQRAFPKDKPATNSRDGNGMLQRKPNVPGEPVFFLREEGKLTFFGRAGMFRIPYKRGPQDLLTEPMLSYIQRKRDLVDFAEAMFGFVPDDKRDIGEHKRTGGYAGRIFVTDARLTNNPQNANPHEVTEITPPILSTPKPTSYQHYLDQTGKNEENPGSFNHYDSPGAKLRGHKLYWRQTLEDTTHIPDATTEPLREGDTQHTRLHAVRKDVEFTFRIYFDNLSDVELGALAWALELPTKRADQPSPYRHMIGMGKPFGMGVIRLEPALFLYDRSARYGSLFDEQGEWQIGFAAHDDSKSWANLRNGFIAHMQQQLGVEDFYRHPRIGDLMAMLEVYPHDQDFFGTMSLDNDGFKSRPILPYAQDVQKGLRDAYPPPAPPVIPPPPNIYEVDKVIVVTLSLVTPDSLRFETTDKTYEGSISGAHLHGREFRVGEEILAVILEKRDQGDGYFYLICRLANKGERRAWRGL